MPLGPLLSKAVPVVSLGLPRHNVVQNPRAATDALNWDSSWETVTRVTTAPYTIPNTQSTAFKVTGGDYGPYLESNAVGGIPLPYGVGPGDWISIQFEALAADVTDEQGFIWFEPGICDNAAGGGDCPDLLNPDWPSDPEGVTDPLPLTGWQRYIFNYQLGADEGWWDGVPRYIDLYLGVWFFDFSVPTSASLYVTNIFIERSSGDDFVPAPYIDMSDEVSSSWNTYELCALPARPNIFPNPRFARDIRGWSSYDYMSRVTSAPYDIPWPATEAVHISASSSSTLNHLRTRSESPFSVGVIAGDWLALQFTWLVVGCAADDGAAMLYMSFRDSAGDYIGVPQHLLNAAYFDSSPRDPLLVTTYLPVSGWEQQFSEKIQVPSGAVSYEFVISAEELSSNSVATADYYVTNVLLEKTTEEGEVISYDESVEVLSEWDVLRNAAAALGEAVWHIGVTVVAAIGGTLYEERNLVSTAPYALWVFPTAIGRVVAAMWHTALAGAAAVGEAAWSITESSPVAAAIESLWNVSGVAAASASGEWMIERRDDYVRTVLEINGHNYNDGVNTFVGNGIKLPGKKNQFDEVRSYTGDIRQVDVHQPLLQATIPLQFRCDTAAALDALIAQLDEDLSLGGTLVYQEGALDNGVPGALYTYDMGISDGPDIARDKLFIQRHVAIFEIQPYVAPW